MTAPFLAIHQLSAVFEDVNGGLRALDDVSFDLHLREFLCVLGPSGSGKTTLLRVIAGLLPARAGQVIFSHKKQPRIGMVFQQANLMPWRSVLSLLHEIPSSVYTSTWKTGSTISS